MDDTADEMRRAKKMIVVAILFCVSLWYSWSEVRYRVFASSIDATVDRVEPYTARGRFGRPIPKLDVKYRFTEEGQKPRVESDLLDDDGVAPAIGSSVRVQYFAGVPGASRLAANATIVPILVLLGMLATAGFMFANFMREFREHQRSMERSRASSRY